MQREASIVTPLAGTTRDVIEVSLDFHGYPIILADTAGLRESEDIVESIGIDRARLAYGSASICQQHLTSLQYTVRRPEDLRNSQRPER